MAPLIALREEAGPRVAARLWRADTWPKRFPRVLLWGAGLSGLALLVTGQIR
jgi:hypothetical protein